MHPNCRCPYNELFELIYNKDELSCNRRKCPDNSTATDDGRNCLCTRMNHHFEPILWECLLHDTTNACPQGYVGRYPNCYQALPFPYEHCTDSNLRWPQCGELIDGTLLKLLVG